MAISTERKNIIETLIAKYNEEVTKDKPDFNVVGASLEALKAKEKELSTSIKHEVMNELAKAVDESPMVAAAKLYAYDVPSHREVKDTNELEYAVKSKAIDPLEFTNFTKGNKHWVTLTHTEVINTITKIARDLDRKDLLDGVKDTETYKKLVKTESDNAKENAKTGSSKATDLTSNTQTIARLQAITNKALGEGKVKLVKRDLTFIENTITSSGKEVGAVRVLTGKKFANILFQVWHINLTGGKYSVEYKLK